LSPDWRPLRAGFQPDVRAKGLSWRQQFRQPAADTGRDFDDKTPELAALEAKVRRLEARAPRGPDYDNALSNLYEAYLEAGGFLPEAAATARKLLRLREKELKASDPRITDAMIDLGTSLARGKPWEEQGQEEARRVLEQALGRLSTLPKRLPASEFAVLSWMAYLEKRTAPELEILERMTAIAQSNIDELGHDALKEHRLRVKDFRHSLSTRGEAFGNASYKERALAAGRKAWLAHETFAIKEAGATC